MAGYRRGRQTPEEAALLQAQTDALAAKTLQDRIDAAQKADLTREGFASDQAINAAKLGLGREELTSKDIQSKREAALGLLGLDQKTALAERAAQGDVQDALLKRADIPADVLAKTLAGGGRPELFNALAVANAAKRDQVIASLVPGMLKAKNDDERRKLGAAFEGTYPGITNDAISKAYPKEGGFVQSTPETYSGPTAAIATGASRFGDLAGELLGITKPTAATATGEFNRDFNYPVLPNTPEQRFVPTGAGSLEGSQIVDGGIRTPSGGFIGTDITPGVAKLIGASTAPVGAGATPNGVPVTPTADVGTMTDLANAYNRSVPVPAGAGEPVAPPTSNFDKLMAPDNSNAPTANFNVHTGFTPEALAGLQQYINLPNAMVPGQVKTYQPRPQLF